MISLTTVTVAVAPSANSSPLPQDSYCVRLIHDYEELSATYPADVYSSRKQPIRSVGCFEEHAGTSRSASGRQQPTKETHQSQQQSSYQKPKAKSFRVKSDDRRPLEHKPRNCQSLDERTMISNRKPSSWSSPSSSLRMSSSNSLLSTLSSIRKTVQERTTTKRNKKRRSHVRFGVVEIREYAICLGDHPLTSSDGPSLSLDWMYKSKGSITVNDMERSRRKRRGGGGCGGHRKSSSNNPPKPKPIPGRIREAMILEHTDCTYQEIDDSIRQRRAIKRQRKQTTMTTPQPRIQQQSNHVVSNASHHHENYLHAEDDYSIVLLH